MADRTPPKLAAALMNHLSPDNVLAGDLQEAYVTGKSAWWYWRQVLAIVARAVLCEMRGSIWWSGAAIMAAMLSFHASTVPSATKM